MIKNAIILFAIIFTFNNIQAQSEVSTTPESRSFSSIQMDYPEGLYATKDDFLNKKPSEITELTPRGFTFKREIFTVAPDNCFFYYTLGDKKVKNTFAICYRGEIFFQIYAILENRNKKDSNQEAEFPNGFVKAKNGGVHFFYMEVNLGNKWGNALGTNGGVGNFRFNAVKGVVWDFANKEFNIFKNCKDYNEFIQSVYPTGVQNCSDTEEFLSNVRTDFNIYK